MLIGDVFSSRKTTDSSLYIFLTTCSEMSLTASIFYKISDQNIRKENIKASNLDYRDKKYVSKIINKSNDAVKFPIKNSC